MYCINSIYSVLYLCCQLIPLSLLWRLVGAMDSKSTLKTPLLGEDKYVSGAKVTSSPKFIIALTR